VQNSDPPRSNEIQEEKINRKVYQYTYINILQGQTPENAIKKRVSTVVVNKTIFESLGIY
jgi:hypothetical protein